MGALEAIIAAPEKYKPILENDAVQVLDITIKKGEATPTRSHPLSVCRLCPLFLQGEVHLVGRTRRRG